MNTAIKEPAQSTVIDYIQARRRLKPNPPPFPARPLNARCEAIPSSLAVEIESTFIALYVANASWIGQKASGALFSVNILEYAPNEYTFIETDIVPVEDNGPQAA